MAALRNMASSLAVDSEVSLQSLDLQARVRVIFDALDSDGTGFLTKESITSLLVTWGVPYAEAMHCFDLFDARSSIASRSKVSFHEFLIDWEPVWRFQLSRIDEAVAQFRLSQELANVPGSSRQCTTSRRQQLGLDTLVDAGKPPATTSERVSIASGGGTNLVSANTDAVAAAEAKAAEAQLETVRVRTQLRAAQERIAELMKRLPSSACHKNWPT